MEGPQEKAKVEKEFYGQMDKATKKRSCCSCRTLCLLFLLLFLLGVGGVYWLWRQLTAPVQPKATVQIQVDASKQLQDKLLKAISKAGPSQPVTIEITEGELSGILAQAANQSKDFPLRDVQAKITPKQIELFGVVTEPVRLSVTIGIVPKVVSGLPVFEITQISAGKLSIPEIVTKKITAEIGKLLAEKIKPSKDFAIEAIQLKEGAIVLTGKMSSPGQEVK